MFRVQAARNKPDKEELEAAEAVYDLIYKNDLEGIRSLVKDHKEGVAWLMHEGRGAEDVTPLHMATQLGDDGFEAAMLLLRVCDNVDVDIQDGEGRTPVLNAAERGSLKLVEQLVETYGAVVDCRDYKGRTVLHWAVRFKHRNYEMLKYFLECSPPPNINMMDRDKKTALHVAAATGDAGAVRILLKNKADPNVNDKIKQTPLLCAAMEGHDEIVKALVDAKADVDSQDQEGESALHWAVLLEHEDIVEILKKGGAKANLRNNSGQTPYSYNPDFFEDEQSTSPEPEKPQMMSHKSEPELKLKPSPPLASRVEHHPAPRVIGFQKALASLNTSSPRRNSQPLVHSPLSPAGSKRNSPAAGVDSSPLTSSRDNPRAMSTQEEVDDHLALSKSVASEIQEAAEGETTIDITTATTETEDATTEGATTEDVTSALERTDSEYVDNTHTADDHTYSDASDVEVDNNPKILDAVEASTLGTIHIPASLQATKKSSSEPPPQPSELPQPSDGVPLEEMLRLNLESGRLSQSGSIESNHSPLLMSPLDSERGKGQLEPIMSGRSWHGHEKDPSPLAPIMSGEPTMEFGAEKAKEKEQKKKKKLRKKGSGSSLNRKSGTISPTKRRRSVDLGSFAAPIVPRRRSVSETVEQPLSVPKKPSTASSGAKRPLPTYKAPGSAAAPPSVALSHLDSLKKEDDADKWAQPSPKGIKRPTPMLTSNLSPAPVRQHPTGRVSPTRRSISPTKIDSPFNNRAQSAKVAAVFPGDTKFDAFEMNDVPYGHRARSLPSAAGRHFPPNGFPPRNRRQSVESRSHEMPSLSRHKERLQKLHSQFQGTVETRPSTLLAKKGLLK